MRSRPPVGGGDDEELILNLQYRVTRGGCLHPLLQANEGGIVSGEQQLSDRGSLLEWAHLGEILPWCMSSWQETSGCTAVDGHSVSSDSIFCGHNAVPSQLLVSTSLLVEFVARPCIMWTNTHIVTIWVLIWTTTVVCGCDLMWEKVTSSPFLKSLLASPNLTQTKGSVLWWKTLAHSCKASA